MLPKFAFLLAAIEASAIPAKPSPFILSGCHKSLPRGQAVGNVSNVTITSGGHHRSFLISIPPTYRSDAPSPAILSYHGGNRNAEDQLLLDGLTNTDINSHSFVIYPQGIDVGILFRLDSLTRIIADEH